MNLTLLNGWRTFKENFFPWTLLGFVYLFAVTQLLEPILEWAIKGEISNTLVAGAILVCVFLAGCFQWLSRYFPAFQIKLPKKLSHYLWLSQALRTSSNVLLALIVVAFGIWVHASKMHFLWLMLVQIPAQVQLFQAEKWRTFFCLTLGKDSSARLVREFTVFQVFTGFATYCLLYFFWPHEIWLQWLVPTLATLWGASVVILEGDSGRPYLVNFVSLLLGTMAGAFVKIEISFIVFVAWACFTIPGLSRNRFWSVENADQDTLL
jgi:hypothetical protein